MTSSQALPLPQRTAGDPPLIGIVGGIGSGKSTIARAVAEQAPVLLIDADRIGHEVLKTEPVRSQLRDTFGDAIFDEAGEIVRAALAKQVFGTETETVAARRRLESITHPAIRGEIIHRIESVDPSREAILLDAPVLLQTGWPDVCDAIVMIETPRQRRVAHVASRGWTAEELRSREASQTPIDEKRQLATDVVDNSGSVAESVRQFLEIVHRFSDASLPAASS